MKAIKINQFGKMEEVTSEYISNVVNNASFNYVVLESYDLHDDEDNGNIVTIKIIGQTSDYFNYNPYEFQYTNPRGEVYVILFNPQTQDYSDITIYDFVEFYEETENMDTTLIEDELQDTTDIDSYDYSKEWIEDDREDTD